MEQIFEEYGISIFLMIFSLGIINLLQMILNVV